jgi:hypothetical protein
MKRSGRSDAEKKLDKLAAIMRGLPPGRIADALRKSEGLTIRLTAAEKEDMRRAASSYGLTITDYLTRLAAIEREIASKERGRKGE